jgi:hypothetical protein
MNQQFSFSWTTVQLNSLLTIVDDCFILGYQFMPKITSISCPFITITSVGNLCPTISTTI